MIVDTGNVTQEAVSKASYGIINAIQNHPPAIQAMAIGTTYRLLIAVLGLNPRDELERAEVLMRDVNDRGFDVRFKAAHEYIQNEIKRK